MKTFKEFCEECDIALYNQYMNEFVSPPPAAAAAVAGKTGGKFIPGVGFVLGAVDTVDRLRKGDWEGATYSGLGAGANLLPGGGTAIQAGLTGLQFARDYQRGKGIFAPGQPFAKTPSQKSQPNQPVSTQPTQAKPQQLQPNKPVSTQPTQAKPQQLQPNQPVSTQPTQPFRREVISQSTGAGGKTSTNTAFKSKLGGAQTTTTYGRGGQQMIRANLGNQGVNKVATGQVAANKSFGATLGGVKGIVRYDAKGNKQFQTLKPQTPPKR